MAGTTGSAPEGGTTSMPKIERKRNTMPIYAAIVVIVIVVIVVAAGYQAGWFSAKKPSTPGTTVNACPTGTTLSGAGANVVNTLVSGWGPAFNTADNNQVSYNPAGSGTGITDLQTAQVDFAASDAPLNASQ